MEATALWGDSARTSSCGLFFRHRRQNRFSHKNHEITPNLSHREAWSTTCRKTLHEWARSFRLVSDRGPHDEKSVQDGMLGNLLLVGC